MKIFLFVFHIPFFISIHLFISTAKAAPVKDTSEIVLKKEMSAAETEKIFNNLQFNGSDNSQFEEIKVKTKTHYIPIKIILWLQKASLLNPEGLSLQEIMREEGYDRKELSDGEVLSFESHIMNSNESTYRESIRSLSIHTLGVIGQSQKLPPHVVNYLRDLILEMRNPNIMPHIINAFEHTVTSYPFAPEWMQKLALQMEELREQYLEIKRLHQKHRKLQEEEMDKSFKEFVEEQGLPSSYFWNQNKIERIYRFLHKIAQTQILPLEIVNELISTLEAEEIPLFTLMDPLLDALMAVARHQGFQQAIRNRLQKIRADKKYISYEGQIDNILRSDKRNSCQTGFRPFFNLTFR